MLFRELFQLFLKMIGAQGTGIRTLRSNHFYFMNDSFNNKVYENGLYLFTSSFSFVRNSANGIVSEFFSPYFLTLTACAFTSLSPTTSA